MTLISTRSVDTSRTECTDSGSISTFVLVKAAARIIALVTGDAATFEAARCVDAFRVWLGTIVLPLGALVLIVADVAIASEARATLAFV